MSEIEKMYKNAGLSNMWVERYNDGYYEHENYYDSYKEMINNMMKVNNWTLAEAQETAKRECSKEFPPFTAEKQIELYCFILSQDKYVMTFEATLPLTPDVFAEGIAEATNRIWQDLTPKEKQLIKEILE